METLIQRLDRQQTRLKNLYFYHGSLQVLLRVLILAAVLFLLDYAVDPPQGARVTMTLLALGYLAYAAIRHLAYPLSRPFATEDMALALERKFPELDGLVISALQFHRKGARASRYMSAALVEAAMKHGAERAEGISWHLLFDTRRIRKLMLCTGALFVLVAGYAILHPDLTGIWARRMLGGAAEWPRSTTLLILLEGMGENFRLLSDPDPRGPQEVLMARGTSLPIRVQVEGRDPGEVQVVMDAEKTGRITAPATRRSDGEYRYRFRNVRESFRFRVRGGDDGGQGRHVDVSIVIPPEVLSVECSYRYPEYLDMPPESRLSSQIEGPEGTQVDARFKVSAPVEEASIALRTSEGEETHPLRPDPERPGEFLHTMNLEKSGTYRVRLVGESGFVNMDAALHSIIVRKDQEPRLRLFHPRRSEEDVAPRGVLVFRVVAEDDYGVAGMRLKYKLSGQEGFEIHDFTAGELDGPYGAKRIVAGHVMDFETLLLPEGEERRNAGPGDVIVYSVEAFDGRPDREAGTRDTGQYLISIVTENEKIRLLTERQIRLKEEILSLRSLQAERLERGTSALEELREGRRPEQVLVSLQIGQNQLTGRFGEATRELAHIFDGYLLNRLDRTVAAATLLDRAVRLRLESEVSESFDPGLYIPLVQLLESGQLGEMDLMERLTVMLGLSLKISEERSPEAAGLIAKGMMSVDAGDVPGWIERSLEVQKEIIKILDDLLDKMEEWGDYQELLQLFRDTIEYQENVNILMREELRKRR